MIQKEEKPAFQTRIHLTATTFTSPSKAILKNLMALRLKPRPKYRVTRKFLVTLELIVLAPRESEVIQGYIDSIEARRHLLVNRQATKFANNLCIVSPRKRNTRYWIIVCVLPPCFGTTACYLSWQQHPPR